MGGSCLFDRAFNVEIGVEYCNIFVVVIFNFAVKCDTFKIQKRLVDFNKNIPEQFILLIHPAKNKKVNKHFKIRR